MSTRWYPIYQRGNPQLRVFLPNFWMKLVKQDKISQPSNKVDFIISSEMTRYDVKNYLEKIYKVPIANVETRNILGKIRRNRFDPEELVKDDDYKVAYVTLQPGHTFEFPDLKIVSKRDEGQDKSKEDIGKAQKEFTKNVQQKDQKFRPGVPTFFGL